MRERLSGDAIVGDMGGERNKERCTTVSSYHLPHSGTDQVRAFSTEMLNLGETKPEACSLVFSKACRTMYRVERLLANQKERMRVSG